MQALWLANCSSVLLFYPYLKASILTPIKQALGQTMEFKTTLKGANSAAFSLRTFLPALIIVVVNAVTLGFGLATLDASINAAQARCLLHTCCTAFATQ